MIKAFKYKLEPTKGQASALNHTLYLCRQLYNAALEERRTAYSKCGVSVTRFQQDRMLPEIKAALPEYKDVHSQVLQDVLKRLDKAFQAFFKRIKQGDKPGYPRFQGRNRFDSFCYPQYKTAPTGKHVYLPKIGNVRLCLSRPVEGKVKTCTVKREADGWHVVFACEVEPKPLPKTGNAIGVDLGLTDIIATSEGELVAAPKYFSKARKALRKAQRRLARRKRGSKNKEKARVQVAKLHQKVRRQRADFLHKLSTKLIRENDVIAVEDLNVKGLASGMLAKSVNDVAWGQLVFNLSYKAEEAGRTLVKVSPNYTSQDCPSCGKRQKKLLSERWHKCACGFEGHRDVVAAQVILGRAAPVRRNVDAVRSCVPQESHAL